MKREDLSPNLLDIFPDVLKSSHFESCDYKWDSNEQSKATWKDQYNLICDSDRLPMLTNPTEGIIGLEHPRWICC
jgi:hypothetical protein